MDPQTELIAQLRSLSPLSPESADRIIAITTLEHHRRNSQVQEIGNTCRKLYFIHSGALRIFYLKEGVDVTESFEFDGSFIARGESLVTMRPSSKGIEALEDSVLSAISTPALFDLFTEFPEIERVFAAIIRNAYLQLLNRIESIQFNDAQTRYQALIREQPEALQRLPLRHIASYLGITQVSLSRIRAKIRS